MRLALFGLSFLLFACSEGPKKLPVGSTCEMSDECSTGLCVSGECLDPKGDDDDDGLINELEAAQGSNPKLADSDGDGELDPAEYDGATAVDSDGDGVVDASESDVSDRDFDCISDEKDRLDDTSDGANSERIDDLCLRTGVCSAEGAILSVMCREGLDKPACEYAAVPGFEPEESSCDGLDNDCDGRSDEDCDSLTEGLIGHWKLDGDGLDSGPHGDHGTVTGATPAADRFGLQGQALRFAKSGDRVIVEATEHPTGEVTASYTVWVRPDRDHVADLRSIFTFGEPLVVNKHSGLVLVSRLGCATYVGDTNNAGSGTLCPPAGHWSFLAVVKSGTSVQFFWDGRLVSSIDTREGQDLEQTGLAIGLSGLAGNIAQEQFFGVIDDLRAYNRVLTPDEVQRLYLENDIADVGTKNRPAQHCLHIRDAAGVKTDGRHWVDIDGDGEEAPFEVFCEMTTDGGGWTLAWVYGFTNFDNFQDPVNAVTPRPDWPAPNADVTVSTTPPTGPSAPGAIPWRKWREFGNAFLVASDLTDWYACEPGEGSINHGLSGWTTCRSVKDVTPTCDGVVPTQVYFEKNGPQLTGESLFFFFDGSKTEYWPTHDPCGLNSTNQVSDPARKGGAILLRPSNSPVQWPRQCNGYLGVLRSNGPRLIDPDGYSDAAPFMADCRFDVERGGWTKLSAKVVEALEREEAPREYLFAKGGNFYRSPVTLDFWGETYQEVTGSWSYSSDTEGDGAFTCVGGEVGAYGIGCANGPMIDLPDERVLPSSNGGGFDAENGTATVCEGIHDVLGTAETCEEDVTVWVRGRTCMTDTGSLLGDGGFDALAAAAERDEIWSSPCWWALGPKGPLDEMSLDFDEVRPGGRPPSLRAENPSLGNSIYALNVLHRQFSVIAGRTYSLTFWAKASARRSIRVFVQPTTFDDHAFYEDLTLEPEWREYRLDFAPRRTFWDTQLDFQLAESSTEAVWLDDIRLADMGPSPCGESPDGNLIGNGNFLSGRTCWRFYNMRESQLASFRVEPAGGPRGEPAGLVRIHGGPTSSYHTTLARPGIPLDAGYRYRLSFKARASEATRIFVNLNRWDLELGTWFSTEHPVGAEWREFSYDFHATSSAPPGGATLEFGLGEMGVDTFMVTDVRLEKRELSPCTHLGGLENSDWSFGLTCWQFEWNWPELDLYAEIDPTEAGALRVEISDNISSFDYAARLAQFGVTLREGHGYMLAFRARAETGRRGYTNLQEWPLLHLNQPVYLSTLWKKHEFPFIATQATGPAGAKLEIGIGGQAATGTTWLDEIVLTDLGPNPCARTGSTIIANGDFSASHLCWEVNRSWDDSRFEAISDDSTFGLSAPSTQLDFEVIGEPQFVGFTQRGLSLLPGVSYQVKLSVKANISTTASFSVHDEVYGNLSWNQFGVGSEWTTYTFDFRPNATTPGRVFAEFQYQQGESVMFWLDDISITARLR